MLNAIHSWSLLTSFGFYKSTPCTTVLIIVTNRNGNYRWFSVFECALAYNSGCTVFEKQYSYMFMSVITIYCIEHFVQMYIKHEHKRNPFYHRYHAVDVNVLWSHPHQHWTGYPCLYPHYTFNIMWLVYFYVGSWAQCKYNILQWTQIIYTLNNWRIKLFKISV